MERADSNEIIKNKSYKKSNSLIRASTSGQTTFVTKLFAIGLANANAVSIDKTNNIVTKLYGTELRKLFGSASGSLYSHIEAACDRSIKGASIFDWQILFKDPESGVLEFHSVVTDATFRDGILTIRYNNFLTSEITNLKKDYTILSLSETIAMKSTHSLRIYELLKSLYDRDCSITGKSGIHEFTYGLTELKISIGIINVNSSKAVKDELAKEYPNFDIIEEKINNAGLNKYPNYKDFNRYVITKAQKEINEKTSLYIECEPIKARGKTAGIRFFVSKKTENENKTTLVKKKKPLSEDEIEEFLDSVNELTDRSFKLSEIKKIALTANYNIDKIKKAYNLLLKQNSVANPIGWVIAAISNDYKENTSYKNANNGMMGHDYGNMDELEAMLLK